MSFNRDETPTLWRNGVALAAGALLALCIAVFAGTGLLLLALPALVDSWWSLPLLSAAGASSAYAAVVFAAANVARICGWGVTIVMALCALCAIGAAALWMPLIWDLLDWGDEPPYALSAISLTVLSVALLHNGGMTRLFTRSPGLRAAKVVACLAVLAPAVIISGMLWAMVLIESRRGGPARPEMTFFFFGPLLFLVLFFGLVGSASLALLIRHNNRKWEEARETISQKMSLDLHCPKCGEAQSLRAGGAKCASCGVLLNIELEEPRCECGYLLFKLASATCPECGREVAEQYRWRRDEREVDEGSAGYAQPQAACE